MRTTRRNYEKHYGGQPDGPDFTETTEGDAPCSVEINTNAKGQAQFNLKLYYASPEDMEDGVKGDMTAIIGRIRDTLVVLGIPMAGG